MSMQHGTQPDTKPNKKDSRAEDIRERKRGVKPTLPARDSTTRTQGVVDKHKVQDKNIKRNPV